MRIEGTGDYLTNASKEKKYKGDNLWVANCTYIIRLKLNENPPSEWEEEVKEEEQL